MANFQGSPGQLMPGQELNFLSKKNDHLQQPQEPQGVITTWIIDIIVGTIVGTDDIFGI